MSPLVAFLLGLLATVTTFLRDAKFADSLDVHGLDVR
jgi:hypothetical protein